MSTLREKRKKERRALRRRKTADWTVVLIPVPLPCVVEAI